MVAFYLYHAKIYEEKIRRRKTHIFWTLGFQCFGWTLILHLIHELEIYFSGALRGSHQYKLFLSSPLCRNDAEGRQSAYGFNWFYQNGFNFSCKSSISFFYSSQYFLIFLCVFLDGMFVYFLSVYELHCCNSIVDISFSTRSLGFHLHKD